MKRRNTIIVLVTLLAIGFAAVSTTLVLNGLIGLGESNDFKIIFTSASIDGTKRNDVISEGKTEISYGTKVLSLIDEQSVLEYEATNTSRNYDADVQIVCNIVDEDSNIIEGENEYVDMTYAPESMSLLAGETKQGSITAKLKKAVTEPMDINIKCTLTGTPKERDELGDETSDPNEIGGKLMARKSGTSFWKYSSNITKVIFENALNTHETKEDLIFDVSENQDKSVMSYLVPNEDTTKYTLYINSDGRVVANENSSGLFYSFSILNEIENLEYLDISNVTDMSWMFYSCSSLASLDLSSFNTSNVTRMDYMFSGCSSLTTLDLSSFNTSKVTRMDYMFGHCSSLTTLDLGNFNTDKVIDISSMFYDCSRLTTLDLGNFDTGNVINMSHMFDSCSSLASLDLSSFNTSNVTRMNYMFSGCSSLIALDVNSFDTSNVTMMSEMFRDCSSLTTLDLSSFNTSKVTSMDYMFGDCSRLTTLNLGNFDTGNVTLMRGMFYRCSSLIVYDLSNVDSTIIATEKMFSYMPARVDMKIVVKDKAAQDAVFAHPNKKSFWTTENVIIKG